MDGRRDKKDYYGRMRNYYRRRAAEYDDAYLGRGAYSEHDLPGLRGDSPR